MKFRADYDAIEIDGHAGNKIVCAMVTALTVSLINNLQRIGDTPAYELREGYFRLIRRGLSIEGDILTDAFLYSIRGLMESYPDCFEKAVPEWADNPTMAQLLQYA